MSNAEKTIRKSIALPGIGEFHLPLTRNDLMIMLVAINMIGIGLETYLAHLISGSVKPAESIPVYFGPAAGLAILAILFKGIRAKTRQTYERLMILGISAMSVVVGVLGTSFHWQRALAPANIPGADLRWDWIIYAPPVVAPLAFAGIGLMGILSTMEEPEPGRFVLAGMLSFQTPMTKTRQLLWLVALGLAAATLSAFLDHGRTDYENNFVWIPTIAGIFGTSITLIMAMYERHTPSDYFIFFWVMILMLWVGVMGMGLHINADLPEGPQGGINTERLIRGAPVMAPMLFANMGLLGIISMVGAEVYQEDEPSEADETTE